ncbi:MAG: methyltransferase, TIGR04325 family [Tannerella sp.]|jgi:putative methyltransferase (TIGR04325 family)|nr:methyltransferase, TIGR04325 family [Tannerella sp.]
MKQKLIRWLPDRLFLFLKGYGWYGNFKSWQAAKEASTGYDAENIVNQVKASLLKVKKGEAVYERDSVLFDKIEYSWELLSAFMWIAAQNQGCLHVMDFGGSLGSTYYQNRIFLDPLTEVSWNIVEQSNYVKVGIESFQDDRLHFYTSLKDCFSKEKINAILFSSVLQYLEFPYEILKEAMDYQPEYIVIDRTGFVLNRMEEERICVQKVPESIYRATYPCRFFNEKKFISYVEANNYSLIFDFKALDCVNIRRSEFKGFVFKRRDHA